MKPTITLARHRSVLPLLALLLAAVAAPPAGAQPLDELELLKEFIDDPAGPGGTATLRFTLTNFNRFDAATGITFTDDLDATLSGLVALDLPVANPCGPGSNLAGTSLLTLSGARLEPEATCTFSLTVQVPAATAPGTYPNTTSAVAGTIAGNPATGAPASDALSVVAATRLTKTFPDDPVAPGGTATLQFTLTNTSATSSATDVEFTDDLDAMFLGIVPTLPADGFCGPGAQMTGTSLLSVTGASLAPGASCTFSVALQVPPDIPGGAYPNTTGHVSSTVDGGQIEGDPASDTLLVSSPLSLTKEFTDDPALPGGTVTLEFTVALDPASPAATGIGFTDELFTVIPGLIPVGLPMNDVCGPGSQLSGSGVLTLSGGDLAPGTSCTFSVPLLVPVDAPYGAAALNTTSAVTGSVGGEPAAGAPATDTLRIASATLAKAFDGPAEPGGTVLLTFTLTNLDAAAGAVELAFSDDLEATLPGLVATGLPATEVCGAGSTLSGTSAIQLSRGELGPGGSCTFSVPLQLPAGAAPGAHLNTTGALTANGVFAGAAASDTLAVLAPPTLAKSLVPDPVLRGGLATVQYTVTSPTPDFAATGAAFSDDLGAALSGLAAVGLPATDVCGPGSTLSGTTVLALAGGSLPPGGSCTFQATLAVPPGAALGTYPGPTGPVTVTLAGESIAGSPASADLTVAYLELAKEFVEGAVTAGETATLRFSLVNPDPVNAAAGVGFTDDLGAVMPGLAALGLPAADVCGAGSTLTGPTLLTLAGGTLAGGGSCTFDVVVAVPATTLEGVYTNVTSPLSAVVAGNPTAGDAGAVAVATLAVGDVLLAIPTVGTWGLALLAALLAAAAVWRLRG